MQVQAPKGQYRVIGLDHVNTLDSPSGPLSKDFESFDAAKDLADRMTEEYLWTYVYDDAGELLYEASSYREQAQQVEREQTTDNRLRLHYLSAGRAGAVVESALMEDLE
jgi:hypothetical protein